MSPGGEVVCDESGCRSPCWLVRYGDPDRSFSSCDPGDVLAQLDPPYAVSLVRACSAPAASACSRASGEARGGEARELVQQLILKQLIVNGGLRFDPLLVV